MEFRDYYATLGVAKTATDKEIKQAFRKLARKYHPDVNPGDKAAEARFKEINEANEVLGDPEKRRSTTSSAPTGAPTRTCRRAPRAPPGASAALAASRARRRHLHDGQRRAVPDHDAGGNGGAPRRRAAAASRTSSRRSSAAAVWATATSGGRAGAAGPAPAPISSTPCSSRSRRRSTARLRRISLKHDGHTRAIDVRIPAGVRDGARVRVPARVRPAPAADAPANLRVKVLPHGRFDRHGDDLTTRVEVPVTTAVLGGEAAVRRWPARPCG